MIRKLKFRALIYNSMKSKYLIALLFIEFFISFSESDAQSYSYSGKVIDANSREALPFVHISGLEEEAKFGTVSDIDGLFKISPNDSCSTLKLSYVGYESRYIDISKLKKTEENIIELQAVALNLTEVVVLAGENPAYRIIRSAIDNRKANNPENNKSFRYKSYNKAILFDEANAPKEPFSSFDSLKALSDSSGIQIYFMMMESITSRSFYFPDKDEERILATKVSGFKHPGFAPLATAFQPFSFYRELIVILDKEFINPISSGSIRRYEYRLEDTLYNSGIDNTIDTTFVISFFPRKGKTFDALKGVLYINTHAFAVEYVLAEPAEKSLLDLRFEQKYELKDNKQWFPVQLNFELMLNPNKQGLFTLQGKSYLSNIEINPKDLKKMDFGNLSVEMLKNAENQPETFWDKYRTQDLSKKELRTYKFIDSIGQTVNFDGLLQFSQDLPRGLLPIGPLALDLTKIVDYNPFEKLRLGLGIYSSSLFSKRFILGGYFGYGFGDKEWKYGGDFTFHVSPKKDISLQLKYENDVSEPAPIFDKGGVLSKKISPQETFARRYLLPRLDYKESLEASFHFRLLRSIQLRPFVSISVISPGYDYLFQQIDGTYINSFKLFNAGAQLRWSFKEKYAQFNGQRSLVESRFPVFYLSYNRGLSVGRYGEIEYQKIIAAVEIKKLFKGLGKTELDILVGWTDRPLPFSLLFNGRGSKQQDLGIYTRNSFQTMGVTEFISNQFVYGFIVHNFGRIPLKSKIFRPEFKICQSVGFGSLTEAQRHIGIPIKTMEKGYYESGILLDKLLSYKAANIAYIGIGLGVFYRYGPYSLIRTIDNFAFNINFSATL